MNYKAGYVGLIGFPNSGKSTLVNALVGEKVSIISSKPQTTRQRVLGMTSGDQFQVVFVDAPGIVKASSGLNHFLQTEREEVLEDADILLAMLNIDEDKKQNLMDVIKICQDSGKPFIVVISKNDFVKKHRVQMLRDELSTLDVPIVSVSAKNSPADTREILMPLILERLPQAPGPFFDPSLYTTQTVREMSAEIIREQCFVFLHQEIPFGLAVEINKFDESRNDLTCIYSTVVLSKKNHQPIVVGKGGQSLKRIGQSARMKLESLLGHKVYLDIHVKVKPNWMKNKTQMKEFGYVSPAKSQ